MFSAPRVVGLLAKLIGIDSDLSAATREEFKLAETFANLIREAGLDSLIFETKEEIAFSEPDDADDANPLWNVDDLDIVNDVPPSDRKRFQFSRGYATLETVVVAAQYYRSTTMKPHRDVAQMKTRFRFIGNEWDLRKMEMHAKENDADSTRRVSRITGLQNLSNHQLGEVMDAFKEGFTLHDCDLEVMALDINREHHYVGFKRKHRICSRQTTKFVSKVNLVEAEEIKKAADAFVAVIREEMKSRPLNSIANADQSGFLKEMHSKRSLAPMGDRTVVRGVESKASLTHSYTVMPIVFADGSMGEKLYVNLQEPKGVFPKTKRVFSAHNLYVTCGTTHIMTKKHMLEWVNKCIHTPSTPSDLLILLDSWSAFKDTAAITAALPTGKTLDTRQIPPGATGLIQPLDVYFFRPFKGLVRRIQSYGFKNCPDFIAYQRDSILKLISLCYSIIRAPTFRPLIQYAWFRAGYLDSPPPTRFQTPVQVCFPRSVNTKGCAIPPCTRPSFILCPKCHKTLCFKCFVIAFHSC
ncbi:hypothetical protein PENTCL1PPCAC_795 [Pristionchus entomophagus]|uniref:Transposase Tc5 C-terminal domain-containing protein n=1 Tax=Pristionchus entomophagus TaxID=358040 RepID=A0AAV5S7Z6_9BILA|nr:hypothetical protein PENTCL1PPCAC_795 [Pristionchus entomophagus]